eukprot:15459830-Alexandrium_andersonii.AAC.1
MSVQFGIEAVASGGDDKVRPAVGSARMRLHLVDSQSFRRLFVVGPEAFAAGITVVVSAGNQGYDACGRLGD